MAFGYLHGLTDPLAPDEIVDWFATFELWMTATLGWRVETGAGTTSIVFRSLGESGGLTMLFMHVWRVGVGNTVRFEVLDDAPGTHRTNENGFVDSGGVQFNYWMSGDKDAIIVCWRTGANYKSVYAGMVMPFALTVPDETYRMIATTQLTTASILRDYDDVWDVNINLYTHARWPLIVWSAYDTSVQISGLWAGLAPNIAGQLKHVSGGHRTGALLDTLTTAGQGEAETDWIILEDVAPDRYSMRTGGVEPTGVSMQGENFAVTSGVAGSWLNLFNALAAHLVGIGWQDLGDPGMATIGREFFTAGESGEDELWAAITVNVVWPTDQVSIRLWDDAVHTHTGGSLAHLEFGAFPVNYWITADRDCFMLVAQRTPSSYMWIWSGISEPFAPGLFPPYAGAPLTPYRAIGATALGAGILRRHDGVWGGVILDTDGAPANTSPNSFDGVTYMLWPRAGFWATGGGWHDAYGLMKYMFGVSGGVSSLDTITVGAQVYTVFFDVAGNPFAMRTT